MGGTGNYFGGFEVGPIMLLAVALSNGARWARSPTLSSTKDVVIIPCIDHDRLGVYNVFDKGSRNLGNG